MASHRGLRWIVSAVALAILTVASSPGSRNVSATTQYIGQDHIVQWSPLPQESVMCPWPEDASYQARGGGAAGGAQASTSYSQPVRVIRDRYPSFSSIAVDLVRDQVVVTDENLFQVLFYNRTENNGPNQVAKPVRIIGTKWDESLMSREDSKTKIEFQCGLYIDPRNGDVLWDTVVNAPRGRTELERLSADELRDLVALLDAPDNDLWDWISTCGEPPDAGQAALVRRLRAVRAMA